MKPQVNFEQILNESGIPTTEAQLTAELEQAAIAAGSQIANDRKMSPFWRLVKAVVITPSLWLINTLVARHVLPNLFVSTAKGFYLELKGQDVNITRLPATATEGGILFTKNELATSVLVPANTQIDTQPINGKVYSLLTLENVVIEAGSISETIACKAIEAGSHHNLTAGYFNKLTFALEGIAHVNNEPDWITTLGTDTEQDDALALRIRNRYAAAGNYHIDAVYRDLIARVAAIRVDQMVFEHDAPRGAGTANCYIYMHTGDVPTSLLSKINQYIKSGYHGHGDDLETYAMPTTHHQLAASYWPKANATETEKAALPAAITERINAAFRKHSEHTDITRVYPMSTFSMSQLIAQCHRDIPALGGLHIAQPDITSALSLPVLDSLTLSELNINA